MSKEEKVYCELGQSILVGAERTRMLGPSLRSGPESWPKDASVGGLWIWVHFAPIDPVSR